MDKEHRCGRPCHVLDVEAGEGMLVPFREIPDPAAGETNPREVFRRVCHTVLSQRHLAPVPMAVQPVHWEYDGTMSLFPQPHALVIPSNGLMHSLDMHGVRCELS